MRNDISPADVRDALREIQNSIADTAPSLALQFTALTASYITPVRLARLTDIDTDAAIWRIPADRHKSGFQQQVPLSKQALSVIARAKHIDRRGSDLVFPSRPGTVLGRNALYYLCRILGLDLTPSHFRTAFRVWCDMSCVPLDLVDIALGYNLFSFPLSHPSSQSKSLEERRLLMQAWADFLAGDLAHDWHWHEAEQNELAALDEITALRERLKLMKEQLAAQL